ncbi:MAG TPA: tetratricopeptide repeat protein, partial [Solirubrobacteraceae bacterium]|nr:tetratricopeptide repeat protein [Solirubrobacteraceae bacterium]
EVAALLDKTALVTLTGPPGIGKSSLVLRVAYDVAPGYSGGAWLVELAPVTDSAAVASAVASVLCIQEAAGHRIVDTLVTRLSRRRLLLVLDNCEHLLHACAELADALLRGCPGVKILTTSRQPLGVDGEITWQVPPLSFPEHDQDVLPEDLMDYEAVRLFVERARDVQPEFTLNPYVARDVAEICRRLDGTPLAIELAAARLESLTTAEIARRLDDRFAVLTMAGTRSPSRHETLRAAIDWSYELLSAPERALLRRLSVFLGGFSQQAVAGICADGETEAQPILELIHQLAHKSLVTTDGEQPTRVRLRLLETIRAYAAERLDEAREARNVRQSHARFFLALAERAEPELTGPDQERWLEQLDVDRQNLRSALEWLLSSGQSELALRLAAALVLYWRVRCHFTQGRGMLEAALAAGDGASAPIRAKALWGAGFLALMSGDADAANVRLEESLARFRQLGDAAGCARALLLLGNSSYARLEPDALSLLEESAALATEADDPWCLSHAVAIAGLEHGRRNDLPAARRMFEECLQVARRAGDKQGVRLGLVGLGSIAVKQGHLREGETLLDDAMAIAAELGDDYIRATALQYLGQLATVRGEYDRADELLRGAMTMLREIGPADAAGDAFVYFAELANARGDRQTARRRFEDALALARGVGATSTTSLQGLAELSAADGDSAKAFRLFREALERARSGGDRLGAARSLHGLGQLARAEGDVQRAAALHNEALDLRRRVGAAPATTASLEAVAALAAEAGRHVHAAR